MRSAGRALPIAPLSQFQEAYSAYIAQNMINSLKATGFAITSPPLHSTTSTNRHVVAHIHALLPEEFLKTEQTPLRRLLDAQFTALIIPFHYTARHGSLATLAEAMFSDFDWDCSGQLEGDEVRAFLQALSAPAPELPREYSDWKDDNPRFPFAAPFALDRRSFGDNNLSTEEPRGEQTKNVTGRAYVTEMLPDVVPDMNLGDGDTMRARFLGAASTVYAANGAPAASLCDDRCDALMRTQPWSMRKLDSDSVLKAIVSMTLDEFVSWDTALALLQQQHLRWRSMYPTYREPQDFRFHPLGRKSSTLDKFRHELRVVAAFFARPERNTLLCINDDMSNSEDELLEAFATTLDYQLPAKTMLEDDSL